METLWRKIGKGGPRFTRSGRKVSTLVYQCRCGTTKVMRSGSLRNSYSCGCVPSPGQIRNAERVRREVQRHKAG